jgi:hypothetical protein
MVRKPRDLETGASASQEITSTSFRTTVRRVDTFWTQLTISKIDRERVRLGFLIQWGIAYGTLVGPVAFQVRVQA